MAYVTQTHTGTPFSILAAVKSFFTAFGRAMVVSSSADARLRKIEALNAKTDEELAAMNLRREDIASYVFRDLMHI